MSRNFGALAAFCAIIAVLGIGCGSDDDGAPDITLPPGQSPSAETPGQVAIPDPAFDRSDEPWKIVVSMPIFADIVREMGGDQVTVTTLIPAGEDPHTYTPGSDLVDAVQAADIVFVNGLGLDQPTATFIETNRPDRAQYVIDFARNVPSPSTAQPVDRPIYAKDVGDDPHLFLDPVLVPVYYETVAHTLTIIDGTNQAYYDGRYQAYRPTLQALHESIATQMEAIPAVNDRVVVMYHNSLIHFANRYTVTIAATLETDGEAGVRQALEQRGPPAVFTEAGFDNSKLEAVADDAGVDVCQLETDTIEDEDTGYLEMMTRLADELADCLG